MPTRLNTCKRRYDVHRQVATHHHIIPRGMQHGVITTAYINNDIAGVGYDPLMTIVGEPSHAAAHSVAGYSARCKSNSQLSLTGLIVNLIRTVYHLGNS